MSNPYTTQTISGYNSAPPADNGSQVDTNEITWAKHKDKLGDPVKTLSEAINTELLSAFGLIFGQEISTHATNYTVIAGDQGKFLSVTATTTITLLAAATAGASFALAIINNGTATVTVDGNASETINGNLTVELSPGESIILTCNGTLWVGVITRHANLYDSNGNETVKSGATASAVNEITVTNAATGNAPEISATGTDTNIDINLTPKGTGRVIISGGGETTISGSAAATIEVSGLDSAYVGGYIVDGYIITAAASSNIYMEINGDTTVTNYYSMRAALTTAYSSGSGNNSTVATTVANTSHPFSYRIMQDPTSGVALIDGKFSYAQSLGQWVSACEYTVTDNITSIALTASSGTPFAIDSYLRVRRLI